MGLGFLWLAVVGVTLQYFLNMEIERYTLATGETAVAGFVRFWKPWGVLFCVFTIVPNMWPGWATSGVTIFTFLMGGGTPRTSRLASSSPRGWRSPSLPWSIRRSSRRSSSRSA